MKNILVHSYYYPPIGGAGAQRPLKMTLRLSALGYSLVVVTGQGPTADRWAPGDPTLGLEVPSGVEVARIAAPEPPPSGGWLGRAERWFGIPSPWTRWWVRESAEVGLKVGGDLDLVYVWMQPYISAKSGVRLARELGRPWVADLGDPWALDEMMVYPTRFHRALELRRMRKHLGTAAAIIMSTPEAARRLTDVFPEFADRPVVTIPNGFDPEDFKGAVSSREDSNFRIVHTGYLHTELGRKHHQAQAVRRILGGSVRGVDILTRSHLYLLRAIDRLRDKQPALASKIELHLAGLLSEADRELAANSPVVPLRGYLSHAESIELIRTADLLFLPMQNLPSAVRATIVPGKTYEYLASGTPILAAVPEGDARDALAEAGNAILCRPDDVAGMADALATQVRRWLAAEPPPAPRAEVVARFEYGSLAEKLADVFDTVIQRAPRVPARL
jgi:glycosyltransferase involved in cell wall biosynthesis